MTDDDSVCNVGCVGWQALCPSLVAEHCTLIVCLHRIKLHYASNAAPAPCHVHTLIDTYTASFVHCMPITPVSTQMANKIITSVCSFVSSHHTHTHTAVSDEV